VPASDRAAVASFRLAGTHPESLDLGGGLFLVSSAIAPIEILLVGSFTIYDLLTTALFVLLLSRGRLPLPPPGILASGLLFLLFALLSTVRAAHPDQSLTQIFQYVFILLVQIPVILFFARSRPMIRAGLVAFMLGTLVGIAGAFLSPKHVWVGRVGAFFTESPNRLGYPVAYVSPFVCWFFQERWRAGRHRFLTALGGVVVAYLMLWALAASGSRSATVGTVVGLTVFLAFRRGFSLRLAGLSRMAAALLAVALCGALLFRSGYFPKTLQERINRTLAAESSLVQDRTMLAVAGWRAFRESPFLGMGLDNFRYVADRYSPTITQQLPHNLWIQLLVHTGLLGTVAFLGIIVSWLYILLRAQRLHGGGERELLWAFLAAMGAILTIHLFIPILIQRQYWWIFGLGLSAALGRETIRSRATSGPTRLEEPPPVKRRWRILHLTAAVAETSGQYNEHCLPLLGERDLAICSFHPPAVVPPRELPCFHGGGSSFGYLRALRAALGGGREYDVIHAHSARAGVLFLLASLLRPRYLARSVYTVQNSYRNYHWGNRLLLVPIFIAYRRLVMCSDACRESMPRWLRSLGGARIRTVQNAVHVERVTQAVGRGRSRKTGDTFVVASVGRLIPIKNPLTVLGAFARAAQPDWRLRFLGEGALRPEVLAEAASRGLIQQVQTPGLLPRDAVFEALGASDVFVSASRGEGLPVAVLEAMACGCPVILSDIQPHREVVGDAAFVPLVDPEDSEGFARELRRLRSLSPTERAAIGASCRRHVEERFGLPAMHAAYERIYDEVCRTRGATSPGRISKEAR
jgi:glycosyltransferase involved in cell wall biosynthesis/O-antigen ligase